MMNIFKQVRFMVAPLALFGIAAVFGMAQTPQPPTAPPPSAPPPSAPPGTTTAPTQDNTPGSDITAAPPRYSFGVRIEYFPERFFQTQYVQVNGTNPIQTSNYFGTSVGSKYTLGLSAEYMLNPHVAVGLDFFRHQEEYTQLDQVKSGAL